MNTPKRTKRAGTRGYVLSLKCAFKRSHVRLLVRTRDGAPFLGKRAGQAAESEGGVAHSADVQHKLGDSRTVSTLPIPRVATARPPPPPPHRSTDHVGKKSKMPNATRRRQWQAARRPFSHVQLAAGSGTCSLPRGST